MEHNELVGYDHRDFALEGGGSQQHLLSVKMEGQQKGVPQDTLRWLRCVSSCKAHRMYIGHMMLVIESTPC